MRSLLIERILARADATPLKSSVVSRCGDLSCGALALEAERYCASLKVARVGVGDLVAISAAAPTQLLPIVVGCWMAGATPAPLPPLPRDQMAALLGRLQAAALISTDRTITAFRRAAPVVMDAAVVITTSGSAGEPKPVVLSWANLQFMCHFQQEYRGLSGMDTMLVTSPLSLVSGMVSGAVSCLWTGATLWPVASYARIRDELDNGPLSEVSLINSVAEVCGNLAKLGRGWAIELWGLRAAYVGGSYCAPQVQREFEDVFGAPLVACYGLSEASPVVAQQGRRAGGIGKVATNDLMYPIPGVAVRCITDGGDTLANCGRLQVRGGNVMLGYLHSQSETQAVLTGDGWLDTQDVATMFADGGFLVHGRANRTFKVNGHKISPEEIERLLESLPGVEAALVVPIEDGARTRLLARVEGSNMLRVEDLRRHLQCRLAPHKMPHRIELGCRLPRSSGGKVLRGRVALQ